MRRHRRSLYGGQHRFYHAGEARPIQAPARRSSGLPNLRGPSSQPAAAGAARFAHGARPHRGAGAGPARARERHSLERPFGRSAAQVAAHRPGGFLRRAPHRHHSGRAVLSGNRRIGRSPAAPRVRAALAPEAARDAAANPPDPARRRLRAGLLPRRAQKKNACRNRARPRRVSPRIFPPAPPQPAQPAVDEEEPLVRRRSAAAAPPAPPSVFSRRAPMKLIGSLASPFARKVRIVLAEKKIDYEFEIDNPWKPQAAAARVNPLGKVPVLVLDDGAALFDSRVIVEFLDNASPLGRLLPAENRERIEVRRWEALADGVLEAGVLARLENQREAKLRSAPWTERQLGKVRAGLAAMDSELGDKPWCAGNGYTLADIAVGVCLGWLDFRYPKMDWKKSHANLARAFAKLSERASFVDTVPQE